MTRLVRQLRSRWRRQHTGLRAGFCAIALLFCTAGLLYPVSLASAANEQAPLLVTTLLERLGGTGALAAQKARIAAPDRTLHLIPFPTSTAADKATVTQAAAERPLSLEADNLAAVMAAYWIDSWWLVRHGNAGLTGLPGRAELAVETSLRQALLENAALPGLSEAKKQAMAQSMIRTITNGTTALQSGDPARRAAVIQAVNAPFAAAGLDLRRLDLTEEGFVPRRAATSHPSAPS